MSRNEIILAGVIGVVAICAMVFYGYQGNQCKIEAIKAGMKGDEIRRACL